MCEGYISALESLHERISRLEERLSSSLGPSREGAEHLRSRGDENPVDSSSANRDYWGLNPVTAATHIEHEIFNSVNEMVNHARFQPLPVNRYIAQKIRDSVPRDHYRNVIHNLLEMVQTNPVDSTYPLNEEIIRKRMKASIDAAQMILNR